MSQTDRPDLSSALARPDLAEQALEGIVRAAAYRDTRPMQAIVAAAAVRAQPHEAASRLDTLIFGEIFDVLEVAYGFAWGRARRTGAVGHVTVADLSDEVLLPTHTVAVTDAVLPLNALVTLGDRGARRAPDLPASALRPIGEFAADAVAVAEAFVDAPYASGGREASGVDAAGLVQQAMAAHGRGGQRGLASRAAERQAITDRPHRGDIAVWSGHAALAVDETRVVHASACLGGVVVETLAAVAERQGDQPVWIRL